MDGDTHLALASEFPPADRDDWLALAGDVEKLRSTTYDGITIEPLYTAADALPEAPPPGSAPFVRGRHPAGTRDGWDVRQVVDTSQGSGAAVAELERGATSVWLRLRDQTAVDEPLLRAVLDGVLLDVAPVVLDAGPRWLPAATALARIWAQEHIDPANVSGSFGADPFGEWWADRDSVGSDADLKALANEARILVAEHPNVRVATIDGTRYHDRGASDGQELGYTVAAAVATLRVLTDAGVDAATAFGQLELRLAATVDQFATIAKFRAARLLLARVAEELGEPSAAANTPLHAVTSRAMATRYDAAVNMLRSTIACFAAGVGGADAITVLPHDELNGPSELGRRLARNTQSILAMESYTSRVVDPAGGSWYVEQRTSQLAEAAWATFREVEAAGGFQAAVEAGLVDERIAVTRQRRDEDVDHRRLPITGVSEYPNVAEVLGANPDGYPALHRWAERFESLRERVDGRASSPGQRPAVFLATLGTPATFTAAASAAANYFGVAGLASVRGPVTSDAAEIAAAFAASGTSIACVCANSANLAEHGPAAESALVASGAARVYRNDGLPADARAELDDLLDTIGMR